MRAGRGTLAAAVAEEGAGDGSLLTGVGGCSGAAEGVADGGGSPWNRLSAMDLGGQKLAKLPSSLSSFRSALFLPATTQFGVGKLGVRVGVSAGSVRN